jgi:hypothetical protein
MATMEAERMIDRVIDSDKTIPVMILSGIALILLVFVWLIVASPTHYTQYTDQTNHVVCFVPDHNGNFMCFPDASSKP